jgi:tetratricopeptide (TPR) repeat protein
MKILTPIFFVVVLLMMNTRPTSAQQISPSTPPPPPPAETPPATPETPPAPPEPIFDPLHAEKSIEVGTFYLKKGNYDAAIDRFLDATYFQPKLARPWRLLGEAYEKKRDNSSAIKSYQKYLEVFPGAEDAAKVKKRITMLEEKAVEQASKHASH